MSELLYGVGNILIYFSVAVVIVLTVRKLTHIYDELFRKILHFVLLGSLAVWTVSFKTWWLELVTVIAFVVIVYPILIFFERFKTYSQVVTERKKGELKNSLIVVFVMFAIVVAVTRGIFNDSLLALASVYAWGIGDAFAALIGKRFGKHKIKGKLLSGEKSVEGTCAMFLSSFISVLTILLIRGGVHVGMCIVISLLTAAVSALCELYTRDGYDTVSCPLASMAVLIISLLCTGGL